MEYYTEVADEIAEINKALSHKARIIILTSLGKLSLAEVTKLTGLSFQALQRHVKALVSAGLIKRGKSKGNYELTQDGKYIMNFLGFLTEMPRVARIENNAIKSGMTKEVEEFLPLAEKTFGAPTVEKLKEALESMKKETKNDS